MTRTFTNQLKSAALKAITIQQARMGKMKTITFNGDEEEKATSPSRLEPMTFRSTRRATLLGFVLLAFRGSGVMAEW